MKVRYTVVNDEGVKVTPADCNSRRKLAAGSLDAIQATFTESVCFVWHADLWERIEDDATAQLVVDDSLLKVVKSSGSRQPDPSYSALQSRIPTPSSVAKAPKAYLKLLNLATLFGFPILGHRPDAKASGIPVALLSTTLGQFLETYRTCHPQERDCKDAIELCKAAAKVHEDEKQLWSALKHIVTSWLPADCFTVIPSSAGVQEPNLFIMAGQYMVGLTELKTDAGGNSYGQVQAYYLSRVHALMDPAVASSFQAHYCPVLGLEINAASLRVCGLCYHNKQVFCDPLTPALHLFCLDDAQHMLQLAQCVAAMRTTFNALSDLYLGPQPLSSSSTIPALLREKFPGATCAPLRQRSLAFHVTLPKPAQQLAVKFVQIRRDGDPAAMHKLWAEAGYAPKLVSHGAVTLPAGYVALHMEHLSPARGWHCLFDLAPMPGGQRPRLSPTEWTAAVVVVQSALAAAHVNIACTHGDARPNNVMVLLGPQMQVQQVYFVDLDWAGKAGARYPVVTNSYIRWSRGAGYGQVMEQWHDRDLMKWECEQLQPAIGEIDMDLSN